MKDSLQQRCGDFPKSPQNASVNIQMSNQNRMHLNHQTTITLTPPGLMEQISKSDKYGSSGEIQPLNTGIEGFDREKNENLSVNHDAQHNDVKMPSEMDIDIYGAIDDNEEFKEEVIENAMDITMISLVDGSELYDYHADSHEKETETGGNGEDVGNSIVTTNQQTLDDADV